MSKKAVASDDLFSSMRQLFISYFIIFYPSTLDASYYSASLKILPPTNSRSIELLGIAVSSICLT